MTLIWSINASNTWRIKDHQKGIVARALLMKYSILTQETDFFEVAGHLFSSHTNFGMVLSVSVTTRIVRRLTVTGWGEYLYTKCSHNQFHIRKNKENICIYIYVYIYIYIYTHNHHFLGLVYEAL